MAKYPRGLLLTSSPQLCRERTAACLSLQPSQATRLRNGTDAASSIVCDRKFRARQASSRSARVSFDPEAARFDAEDHSVAACSTGKVQQPGGKTPESGVPFSVFQQGQVCDSPRWMLPAVGRIGHFAKLAQCSCCVTGPEEGCSKTTSSPRLCVASTEDLLSPCLPSLILLVLPLYGSEVLQVRDLLPNPQPDERRH